MAEEKTTTTATGDSKEVEEGKVCAILAWIFPIGLIWYLVDEKMKKNGFARFHVQQSLVLFIASIVLNLLGGVIPVIGWFIILPVAWIATTIFWILGIINAIGGKKKELPIIGQYGSKFNI